MKRKSRGQTLVEFALTFPFLMSIIFGTIDFGYYVFAWSEFQFAARRTAEQASVQPPREARTPTDYQSASYRGSDPCLRAITDQAARSGAFNFSTSVQPQDIALSYHNSGADATPRTGARPRRPMVTQVLIYKEIRPLTPLASAVFRGQPWKFTTISRRTVVFDGALLGGTSDRIRNCQD